jgi:hypothetical protein
VSVLHAVAGTGGVGKTQLAAGYARARLAEGWRLVAWVTAEDTGTLQAGLDAVADAMGLSEGGTGHDAGDPGLAVRQRLETDGDRCLLVLDNAEDPDVLRPFVPAGESGDKRPGGRFHCRGGAGVPCRADWPGGCDRGRRGGRRAGVPAAGAGSGRGGDRRAAHRLRDVPRAAAGAAGRGVPDPGSGEAVPARRG